jgi:hypothetical protein
MITLNTRKLTEMMEANGPALVNAVDAVRDDVANCRVDAEHQKALKAIRASDSMLTEAYLIEQHETMEAAIEHLLEALLEVPENEDAEAIHVYLHKAREIKKLLQYGD